MEALGMGTFCESITTAAPAAQPHTALEFFLSDECKSYLLLVQCASLIAPYLSPYLYENGNVACEKSACLGVDVYKPDG